MRKLLLLAALAAAVLALPGPAAAASPCWKHLLVDAYDFRIDHTYPAGCYVQAMKHMSRDLKDYSDLSDILSRALATVTAKSHRAMRAVASVPVPPTAKLPPAAQPAPEKAPFEQVAQTTDPGGSPSSVPVPLIVLGGLGVLLAAGGAAGAIARRRRRG